MPPSKVSFRNAKLYKKSPCQNNRKKAAPRQSFAKRVNALISAKIENKISASYIDNRPINFWPSGVPTWFDTNYTTLNFFNLAQGVGQGDRVGNTIKLKRWVIKGLINPSLGRPPVDPAAANVFHPYSYQGTATVMLIKLRNGLPIPVGVPKLWQDGNIALDPLGTQYDKLQPVNKDLYKVYWRKSFKLGCSNTATNSQATATNWPLFANNDYKVSATFGLDVCKYIGRNAKITYEDAQPTACVPSTFDNLSLICVWSPLTQNLYADPDAPYTWYSIATTSYFEYEDA